MLLDETNDYTLRRQGRFLFAALRRPHRVLSTCPVNGGLREDLACIANHQSCEAIDHPIDRHKSAKAMTMGPVDYHEFICTESGLPPATTALMSTAANMQCAVLARAIHGDLAVRVVATAGVLGNATRAGDPAGWHETPSGSVRVDGAVAGTSPAETRAGTIVILAFINRPCTPGCLVRASTIITEAKSTALLDLRMPSLQSPGLATGTGTDQLAIAAPLAEEGDWERHWAGSHNTLGALLGRATHDAVSRSLLLQNGLCPELRRTVCGALGRHGCDEDKLRALAKTELDAELSRLFIGNLQAVIHDPQAASAAYCLAESVDLARAGVLHEEVVREAILNQAALLAAASALKPVRFAEFREILGRRKDLDPGTLAALAVILGFAHKWT
uniref:Adenosylcobinamide amidohydrolase n=1 Tax=Candidatus Kentrum sp. FW TaxID=2126338 RepID=A0A450TK28_9GAMM|nr:MAG: Adenosylcobinamide amidohydrolase [Candidatus Kentron sp. FW]